MENKRRNTPFDTAEVELPAEKDRNVKVREKIQYEDLGDNIRHIRRILRLSQEGLADLMGCQQAYISTIENRKYLDEDIVKKVAEALNVPVELIENFDIEKVIYQIQNNYDAASVSLDVDSSNHHNTTTTTTTNEFDVIKLAVESNNKLYERALRAKDLEIIELKAALKAANSKK